MMLDLHTEFTFDSAHKLDGYKGKCCNVHGHSWRVECFFHGDNKYKDNIGILVDFGIVKEVKELLDHKYLNDILSANPTAENITEFIYLYLKKKINDKILIRVRVYETSIEKETYCEGGDGYENT